jgi:hypothetical protein
MQVMKFSAALAVITAFAVAQEPEEEEDASLWEIDGIEITWEVSAGLLCP